MKKGRMIVGVVAAALAWGQPVLRSTDPVVNGGSYAPGIAPGSIFVVFGTNLAGPDVVLNQSLPLQTALGGVSVRFTPVGGGAAINALMIYTTRNQVAGLLPSSATPGDYNVTVTYNNQTSAAARVSVVARNFGIVSADSSGSGQAQVQNYRTSTEWDLNRVARGRLGPFTTAPANPGQVLVIWGTGLGADSASDLTGGVSQNFTANTRVILAGREITPAYAGRSSGLPGTDQINFTLPADAPTGCSVPLQVRIGDSYSNTTYIAIAAAGRNACQHPYLTEQTLTRLAEGGTMVTGSFSLLKQSTSISVQGMSLDMTTEAIGGSFQRIGVGGLAEVSEGMDMPVGACQVYRSRGDQEALLLGPPPVQPLDAGAQLTLNGPNASNVAVPRDADSRSYYKSLAQTTSLPGGIPGLPGGLPNIPGLGGSGSPVIAQGTYTLRGTGGADIGPFSATVTVPQPITWTNKSSITNITRSSGVTVTWSGGGTSDFVSIIGTSAQRVGGTDTRPIYQAVIFTCITNASARTFTVPASVLTQLPPDAGPEGMSVLGIQQFGDGRDGRFTAPLTAGGNTDFALFNFTIGELKSVSYR